MLSSLCLAYVHLRLQEMFGSSQWFGAMNALFVGDILQLPPVNGSMVFQQQINCRKARLHDISEHLEGNCKV